MKRLFHGAIIGIAIGVMIALICSTIFARNEFHPVSPVSAMGCLLYTSPSPRDS